jgi:hypothetical protein
MQANATRVDVRIDSMLFIYTTVKANSLSDPAYWGYEDGLYGEWHKELCRKLMCDKLTLSKPDIE